MPWQSEVLPITFLYDSNEIDVLREVVIDLNAFKSYAKDDLSLDIINMISIDENEYKKDMLIKSGMKTFPLFVDDNKLIFRIPIKCKLILKNWLLDASNSTPFRIDSWNINVDDKKNINIEHSFGEPESYL